MSGIMTRKLLAALSPLALLAASCAPTSAGENAAQITADVDDAFKIEVLGTFDEPWAMTFVPGTGLLVITERGGTIAMSDTVNGRSGTITGAPKVAYGGQGGLGDVAFLPPEAAPLIVTRTIYLSWAEEGQGGTRGAAVGRGTMKCLVADECEIENFKVIWRQTPKVTGNGHYSHRIAFSPDGKYLFVSSGERQKFTPAQDLSVNLGKIVRLNLDGTPAPGNPFADKGGVSAQIWTYGHRNVLGLQFDATEQLWDLEHGPAGGDELNLVKPGQNYGWPLVSDGDHYDGKPIPRHATRPDLAGPAISWNPVIAPGDFIFYSGKLWPEWKGQALIAGMVYPGLVRVRIDGARGTEVSRYPLDHRIRDIAEGPDGSLYILEDGKGGRLLRLTPK
jgi:aldose sugar dehydrogenase